MNPSLGKVVELTVYDFQKDTASIKPNNVIRTRSINILSQKNPTLGNSSNTGVTTLRSGMEYGVSVLEKVDTVNFLLSDLVGATATGLQLVSGNAYATVAATLAVQATATAILNQWILVTAADSSNVAVKLPAVTPLQVFWITNISTQTVKIFPFASDTISGSAQNAAVNLLPGAKACFYSNSTAVAASATLGIWYQIL